VLLPEQLINQVKGQAYKPIRLKTQAYKPIVIL
jgi:hypothetical protein